MRESLLVEALIQTKYRQEMRVPVGLVVNIGQHSVAFVATGGGICCSNGSPHARFPIRGDLTGMLNPGAEPVFQDLPAEVISKCYADAVDDRFQQIRSGKTLPSQSVRQLVESGFAIIPGPTSGDPFNELTTTYDEVMAVASGPDFKIASTTIRMSNLLSFGSVFEDIYLYPPLLEACSHIVGQPFKLSSFLARTLRAGAPSQELHADLARGSGDAPLVGFILMIDSFREDNGATRFVPTSQNWTGLPCDRLSDTRAEHSGEVLGCGERGTMIIFNGAIWHGHTANVTPDARRSIQGYFVRRSAQPGVDFQNRLPPAARARMSPLARYLLALDEPQ